MKWECGRITHDGLSALFAGLINALAQVAKRASCSVMPALIADDEHHLPASLA